MKPLKPALSYSDQIRHLTKNHGLIINDVPQAVDILSTVNYYRLSAYGIGLQTNDRYHPGIRLETLYSLYRFDSHLRYLLLAVIEEIEIDARTKIAYYLSVTYGAEAYRDPNLFIHRKNKQGVPIFQDFTNSVNREIEVQKNAPFVKHHIEEYGGHFPIWVAVELFTFGMLSKLYTIMQTDDKKEVSKQFGVGELYLESWLISLVEMRNICAHYGRVYNRPLTKSPRLFPEQKKHASNRLFPLLLAMKKLCCNQSTWVNFYESLHGLINGHPEANLCFIGFPPNWEDLLL